MCGIFGFLSPRGSRRDVPGDGIFRSIAELARVGSLSVETLADAAARPEGARVVSLLETAQAEAYRWLGPEGFIEVLTHPSVEARLRETASTLRGWLERLEGSLQSGGPRRQNEQELVNRLLVGGKDVLWQLERDLLDNLAPVRSLLPDDEAMGGPPSGPGPLLHAWELNLLLRSLDRLEVRGRDSAGLAVYVRFPDPERLEEFLTAELREELGRRSRVPTLSHTAALRPATDRATLLHVFKVASEVGRMGDNVCALRQAIAADRLFQAAIRSPGAEIQCLAHTRWASNGIISLANCHPVDGALIRDGEPTGYEVGGSACESLIGTGEIVAVLNGDVDNYVALRERYVRGRGFRLDDRITTDAKIIPIVVGAHYRETGDLLEAFRKAFAEFEGSMAIGVMAADRPRELIVGQKGSGQGLFLGLASPSVAVASELYGLVELTPKYVKAEGDRLAGGEIFHLRAARDGVSVVAVREDGSAALSPERARTAQIMTRDIHRGDYPHFFLKEISESVESVRRTLRGRLEVGEGAARFHLGPEVLGEGLVSGLRSGSIRRILCIGQGTASVAAAGIAFLLERALRRAPHAVHVSALKATELSGHSLTDDMSDALVVAVSQSGTTTDTNRTVDLARERGAWILCIVNRRNSDLVFKSRGVLYTSDGRDIEMSVASTKAFYAQNVAGQVLALALAAELGSMDPAAIASEARDLLRLPELMALTLELGPRIGRLAGELAVRRRHWAVVGTGAGKVAADEVRIKLSELCYKSIAVDFLEDKKHIDLSSEPLILVCASGSPPENVSDLVKEVAIFKAHKSLPIVIADAGEDRFAPYAAGTVHVPAGGGTLGYLLATMVGHLLGYHAAAALDSVADRLRAIRAEVLDSGQAEAGGIPPMERDPGLTARILEAEGILLSGGADAGIGAGVAMRLHRALEVLLGRLPSEALEPQTSATEGILAALTDAISELSRPIDAIKHQAKTVTVGISRGETGIARGPLLKALAELGLLERVAETNRSILSALEPVLASVDGTTLYRVEGLDPLGRPTEASTIRLEARSGCAASIPSRTETTTPLAGTKWGVLKEGRPYLGFGTTDERRILIVPATGPRSEGALLLYHLTFAPRRSGDREARLRALRAMPSRLERLRVAVTERNASWRDEMVDAVDNVTLFLSDPDALAEELLAQARTG